ncbi:MAG: neutral/alkaline non-lysosomal ceramidase N-terminal domain-containing protein, partial [Bacteroidales bacterium]|nr:neutral/alkaline non-lysosomal ceramidase N-terminal domain-containing protein [Bacteroidales bacterium]
EINITPENPIIMSGYGSRDQPFKGVHDSIYAQAIYLKNRTDEALIITADLIGFSHENVKLIKGMIREKTGIPENKMFITAAHNHGGPVNGTYGTDPPSDVKEYVDELHSKLVQIADEAQHHIVPVRIGYKKGECMMNINRRAVYSEGEVWLGRNPEGVCDHDLDIVKFCDLQDNLLAVFVNYPCHGTCTGQDNYLITGDWPGISARMLKEMLHEEMLHEEVIVMVTAGASADINPIYGPNNNFRETNAVAYGVASEARRLVSACIATESTELLTAQTAIKLPGKKRWESSLPQESVPDGEVELFFSGIRIGNIMMIGISGELFTEIGLDVKNGSVTNTMILTHCNGASGYICTDQAFEEGGYEPQVSHLMPGTEGAVESSMRFLVSKLRN